MTDTTPGRQDELPVRLPAVAPVRPSPFGPAAIDLKVNKELQALVPDKRAVLFDVKLTSRGQERTINGVLATRFGDTGQWGAALGGFLDLRDRRNYGIEIVGIHTLD